MRPRKIAYFPSGGILQIFLIHILPPKSVGGLSVIAFPPDDYMKTTMGLAAL